MDEQQEVSVDIERLIDYYKWIASLAVFILTISATLGKANDSSIAVSMPLAVGWCFLAACIFFNVQIIKSLVVYEVGPSPYLPIYGNVQHWCFYAGTALTSLGLAVRLGFWAISAALILSMVAIWQMAQAATWLPAAMLKLRNNAFARRRAADNEQSGGDPTAHE